MKAMLLLCLLFLSACTSRTPEQELIVNYMKQHANDPGSYEPLEFRFLGPATYDNTGVVKGDSKRTGDLYEHTYRAKNGFGALMLNTTVFAIEASSLVTPLEDSLGDKARASFRP